MIKHRNSAARLTTVLSLALLLASLIVPVAHSRTYAPTDQVSTVTDAAKGVNLYAYGSYDELRSVTSADQWSRQYLYECDGKSSFVTGTVDEDNNRFATYRYDAQHNRTSVTDQRSLNTGYSYDALNRLKSLTYSDETVAFTYGEDSGAPVTSTNSNGCLAKLTDGSGSTSYAYDSQGRVTEKRQTVSIGTGSQTGITKYSYNPAGQLQTLTTASGQTIDYGYGNNQITSIKVNGQNVLTGAAYFPFGDVKGWNWGNGHAILQDLTPVCAKADALEKCKGGCQGQPKFEPWYTEPNPSLRTEKEKFLIRNQDPKPVLNKILFKGR